MRMFFENCRLSSQQDENKCINWPFQIIAVHELFQDCDQPLLCFCSIPSTNTICTYVTFKFILLLIYTHSFGIYYHNILEIFFQSYHWTQHQRLYCLSQRKDQIQFISFDVIVNYWHWLCYPFSHQNDCVGLKVWCIR